MSHRGPKPAPRSLEELLKSMKKTNLNRPCWDNVIPLTDKSNWVKFDDDEEDHVHINDIKTHAKIPISCKFFFWSGQINLYTTVNKGDNK